MSVSKPAPGHRVPVDLIGATTDPQVQATLEPIKARSPGTGFGVANMQRTVANSPTVFDRFMGLAHALRYDTQINLSRCRIGG